MKPALPHASTQNIFAALQKCAHRITRSSRWESTRRGRARGIEGGARVESFGGPSMARPMAGSGHRVDGFDQDGRSGRTVPTRATSPRFRQSTARIAFLSNQRGRLPIGVMRKRNGGEPMSSDPRLREHIHVAWHRDAWNGQAAGLTSEATNLRPRAEPLRVGDGRENLGETFCLRRQNLPPKCLS